MPRHADKTWTVFRRDPAMVIAAGNDMISEAKNRPSTR